MASNQCTCKAELASLIREVVRADPFASGAMPLAKLANALEQTLPPAMNGPAGKLSPAPAEPQEPCMVVEYADDAYPFGIETSDRSMFWLWGGPRWQAYQDADFMRRRGNYKTRASAVADLPAARAALLAASEPGKAESKPGRRTMPGGYCAKCGHFAPVAHLEADAQGKSDNLWWCASCRWDATQADCTNPAPAPFDAAKWAEGMVHFAGRFISIESLEGNPAAERYTIGPTLEGDTATAANAWRRHIAASLTAAHEAGKAEAGQPRPRRFSVELPKLGERIFAYDPRGWYFSGPFKNTPQGATHWHPESVLPAPPAEKEGTR